MSDTLAARVLRTLAEQPTASCLDIQRRMDANYNVHAIVSRLVAAGLATSPGWSDIEFRQGGKRRRLYAITDAGRELLTTRTLDDA
jgi:DNA-binding PadR family transcriptional regulator